jgi:hypothetical protein
MFQRTPEEAVEITERPIDPYRREDFTDAQYAVRLAFAKRFCDWLIATPDATPEWARPIYAQVPMWACYSSEPEGKGAVRRVYDVFQAEDDTLHVHAVTARIGWNNYVVGGIPMDDIKDKRIERVYVTRVINSPTPGLFIDPLGFLEFIRDQHRKH